MKTIEEIEEMISVMESYKEGKDNTMCQQRLR